MTGERTYQLGITMPAALMQELSQAAADDLRTAEAEALWLIRDGLTRKQARPPWGQGKASRLRDGAPLFRQLQAAHLAAAQPSTRQLARTAYASGYQISHSTVAAILNGQHFPSWTLVEALAAGLGVEAAPFKDAWDQAVTGKAGEDS